MNPIFSFLLGLVRKSKQYDVYHGTRDVIDRFDLDHPGRKDMGYFGKGVYTTDNPDMASLYAEEIKKGPAGPNVMPLKANLKNPYFATEEDRAMLRNSGIRSKEAGQAAASQFTQELKKQGHDGVIFTHSDQSREIVVFDPKNIRSRFEKQKSSSNVPVGLGVLGGLSYGKESGD